MTKLNFNQEFDDATSGFVDTADTTKKVIFDCSGVTTATTRTVTWPDQDFTVPTSSGGTPQYPITFPLEDLTRYTTVVTGSGAVSTTGTTGFCRLRTGATDGSKAELNLVIGAGNFGGFFDDNPDFYTTSSLTTTTADAHVSAIIWGSHTDPDATGAITSKHVGFILDTTVLDASNANGTTQTTTDISSGVTVTIMQGFRVVVDSGTNHKFYVDQTLKATHTTNLASGDIDFPCAFYIKNDSGVTTTRDLNTFGTVLYRDAE